MLSLSPAAMIGGSTHPHTTRGYIHPHTARGYIHPHTTRGYISLINNAWRLCVPSKHSICAWQRRWPEVVHLALMV